MKILNHALFHELNLSYQEIFWFCLLCSCFLVGIGIIAKRHLHDRHRLAWVSSLVNASITTSASLVYLIARYTTHLKLVFFEEGGRDVFHSIDNFSTLVCIWFGLANSFDLIFGLLCYREHLGLLTSYIHHALYIWMMVLCTTGHGGFTTITPFASCFTILVIEEFPILLLSFGNVFPQYDTDIAFGISFFLLRLVYHLYCMVYAIYSGVDVLLVVLFTVTLGLHIYWFVGFTPFLSEILMDYFKKKRT